MENKSTSSQLPTALRLGNTVTTDKAKIIENFNKHLSTAGNAFLLATPTQVNSSKPPQLLRHTNPDSRCSERAAKPGPVQIKLSAEIIATPITSLFNLSFITSEIPKDWKAAAVISLFKGGDTLDPNCYTPISILPCLSKVFESQVNKQIIEMF